MRNSKFMSEGIFESYHHTDQNNKRRRCSPPLTVIGGQLILLATAYGIFAAVHARGQLPLAQTLADLAQRNPQAKTYIVTFLASGLSAWSSYLFSQAVRHAIVVSLTRPIRISTLGLSILISRRSLIFRRRQIQWVILGIVLFLATLGQTASWTVILAPIQIVVSTPLEGTEIDFTSDVLSNQFIQLWNAPSGIQKYVDSEISATLGTCGVAGAGLIGGDYSLVNFAGVTYSIQTRGILPVQLSDSADLSFNSTALVTANTKPFPPSRQGFNFSMVQQALTVLTKCESLRLDANTNPPLQRFSESVEITVNGQLTPYTAVGIETICNGVTSRAGILSSTNNTLLSNSCAEFDPDNGNVYYTMIIDGQGVYENWTAVCMVYPQILEHTVIQYSDAFVYTVVENLQPPPFLPVPAPITATVQYVVDRALSYGQSAIQNTVGDSMATILAEQAGRTRPANYTELWESFLRGVVECTGTAMKTNLASSSGPLRGEIPFNMRRTINGTAFTTTYGWEYRTKFNNVILVPITFVALASIAIVLVAQCVKLNRGTSLDHPDFDPNDPLLLMAAASAGGMQDTFRGLTPEDSEEGGKKKVKLGQIENREGFVVGG
ncbi:hypothetical protein C8J57DRAFT_1727966 [Mycena rebaudengoi]|nr:hypothetical protein C8J57DRAFT_1727966 [Mycena rebaudengoi]